MNYQPIETKNYRKPKKNRNPMTMLVLGFVIGAALSTGSFWMGALYASGVGSQNTPEMVQTTATTVATTLAQMETTPSHTHSFGEWETIISATCLETGKMRSSCECGEEMIFSVPALGHSFGEWETVIKATCTEKGKMRSVCECGKERTQEVPVLGHNEVIDKGYAATKTQDGLTDGSHCSVCNEILVEQKICGAGSQGLKYTVLTAATCEITGVGTCTDINLAIPRYIDGYEVIGIGTNAFYNCTDLISVMIPDSVTIIKNYAFYSCVQLTSVTIPDSVKTIEEAAFYACRLTSVTIPKNVTTIQGNPFLSCWYLKNIVVSKDNTSYKSIDGILFTYDEKKIISYPAGKEGVCTIPESVTSIEEFCFNNCDSLTSVTIPDGVKTIDFATFAYCDYLRSVTIPNSITSMYASAFSNCTSLTSIIYSGTISGWNAITKSAGWNEATPDYTVYCTDGTITKSGEITYN